VQAANGDLTATDRGYLDTEFQQLKLEMERLAEKTEFNGKEMLAGSLGAIDFQVGINTTSFDVISIQFGGVSLSNLGLTSASVTGTDATNSLSSIDAIDLAFETINSRRADFGAKQNRMEVAVASLQTIRTNVSAANSRIRDVDMASETSALARSQVLMQAGTSVLAQANQVPQIALSLLQ